MRTFARSVVIGVLLALAGAAAAHAVELQWWSHWAIEDAKKAVLFEAKRRFEAKNPGHTVTITFYEKKNMWPALRAAFTAGSGFPDVFYYDMDVPEFMTAAGSRISRRACVGEHRAVRQSVLDAARRRRQDRDVGRTVEAASDELYYNKKLFKELGIAVPAGYAFTQDQFKDVVAKCAKAGHAAFATGAADRDWAAHYIPNALLTDKLGADEFMKLLRGELSWKDPRVVEVFHYYKELIDLGAYAKTLNSMTLAEAHRYFHTEQKACMFPVGSWYTGRAFVPPDKGGQPKDFELGMLNNTLMKDGKGHGQKFLGVAGSLGVAAKSPNLPLAIKVADSFADVEIGNMWMARTGVQTGIKTDPARIDSPLKWYFDEYGRVNKNTKWVDLTAQQVRVVMKPGLWDTYVATVNQGLPNKLLGPDEALAKLEEARLKGK
jgi:multiple sugar transport system substrate-binding protein